MAKTNGKAEGETPKRGRGRPRGQPKTGGRKPKVSYATRGEVAGHLLPKWAALAEDILDGVPLQVSGPTGKPQRRIATMDEKISVLRMVGGKVMADLQSSTLQAEIEVVKDSAGIRPLARAVLGLKSAVDILKQAEITDEPVAEHVDPTPAPHQLLLGRDRIIDVPYSVSDQPPSTAAALNNGGDVGVAGSASPPSFSNANTSSPSTSHGELSADEGTTSRLAAVPSSSSDRPLQHGDIIQIKDNGAHCWWDQNRKKWACFCNNNLLHGWRGDKAVALEHAASLPVGNHALWQAHPFAHVTAQQISDEPRADNRPYPPMHDVPKVYHSARVHRRDRPR